MPYTKGSPWSQGQGLQKGVGPSGGRVEKKEKKGGDLITLGVVQVSEQYE